MRRILAIIIPALLLAGCTSDELQNAAQEKINKQAYQTVGLPNITRFTEKRLLKVIYELRDEEHLSTYTYTRDMNGHLHSLCSSFGYGIPYGTQYSAPSHQEPNGLYSPATAEATWVLCVNPNNKKVEPVYEEDRVTVSPFPLKAVD